MSIDRKILIVDDNVPNAMLVKEGLELEGWSVQTAPSGKAALEVLRTWDPHLILLDQDMPGMTGLETLGAIKALNLDIDVMFLSAHSDIHLIRRALETGADDYLRRPFLILELVSRIKVRFRIRDLREQLVVANQQLMDLADHDDLTGLYNMRSMAARIEHELQRALVNEIQIACFMLDMDHFKRVNDEHDHLFGSFVIQEVGKIIASHVRSKDYPARYGGDEYLMITVDTNYQGMLILAERLRAAIEAKEFTDGRNRIRLTASIGFAMSPLGHAITSTDLVRMADHALYQAKENGRNCFCGWDGETVLQKLKDFHTKKKAA